MKALKKIKEEGNHVKFFSGFFVLGILLIVSYYGAPLLLIEDYQSKLLSVMEKEMEPEEDKFIATHLDTPPQVKGVYMTSWVAGTPKLRNNIINLINETELNSVVIDIKDDTGKISYQVDNPKLKEIGWHEERIPDIKELIASLHRKGIYVIGRIAVFQDPFMSHLHPEWAVQKASDRSIWKDRKGLSFIDAGTKEYWDLIVLLAKDAYSQGFDEINFDYIRFPSDGQMKDIYYPRSEDEITADPAEGKARIVKRFFAYLDRNLQDIGPISADLFGMTTTNTDDLNIGQILEFAMPYFDYIAPMVYPSHYPTGFYGFSNVNAHPYEIVNISMSEAVRRQREFRIEVASSTPNASYLSRLNPNQFRPWLQDNDYPIHYTPEMVRAQIQATYDAGLDSWMLWDAANTYTRAALRGNSATTSIAQ